MEIKAQQWVKLRNGGRAWVSGKLPGSACGLAGEWMGAYAGSSIEWYADGRSWAGKESPHDIVGEWHDGGSTQAKTPGSHNVRVLIAEAKAAIAKQKEAVALLEYGLEQMGDIDGR